MSYYTCWYKTTSNSKGLARGETRALQTKGEIFWSAFSYSDHWWLIVKLKACPVTYLEGRVSYWDNHSSHCQINCTQRK